MFRLLTLLLILSGMGIITLYGQALPQQPDTPLAPMKVLAEGPVSNVERPFFAVVRDAETYRQLQTWGLKLPAQDKDYFAGHALIAAFLGHRPTAGYSVAITRRKSHFVLRERRPQRGAMTAQIVTTPFQVVEITLPLEDALEVKADAAWLKGMRSYTVTRGDFTASGGFAGEMNKFRIAGHIKTMAYNNLRTFVFGLIGGDGKAPLKLDSAATGFAAPENSFMLPYLHAGTFVKQPGNLLLVNAKFDLSHRKIEMAFSPLPNNIADGFEGQGKLTAISSKRY